MRNIAGARIGRGFALTASSLSCERPAISGQPLAEGVCDCTTRILGQHDVIRRTTMAVPPGLTAIFGP